MNEAAAEDAFQATFYVLVRKVTPPPRARDARQLDLRGCALRSAKKEGPNGTTPDVERQAAHSRPGMAGRGTRKAELRSVIDEALAIYRNDIVARDSLLSGGHAARGNRPETGMPGGTVESRLSRARNQLAQQARTSGPIALGLNFGTGAWSPASRVASRIRRDHRAGSRSRSRAVI